MTQRKAKIMVVDDDAELAEIVGAAFRQKNFEVRVCYDPILALNEIKLDPKSFGFIVSDLIMPSMHGLDLLSKIRSVRSDLPVIFITAQGSVETAVRVMEAGAHDFVVKPISFPQLFISAERALNIQTETSIELPSNRFLLKPMSELGIVGNSAGMKNAVELAQRVSNSHASVLILGECGTGKEVIAKIVHDLSSRKNKPFIALNCSAIPENLLESELFGYVKGAFTGAADKKVGLFEEAHEGTLFLDEIGDLSPTLQAKLLRVLQEKKIKRLGENAFREVDVRILSATNRDLKTEIANGRFREDLFYRLNVVTIHIPPLRERVEDIIPLAEHFLRRLSEGHASRLKKLSNSAAHYLKSHRWPGNVRELENGIERAFILSTGPSIEAHDLIPSDYQSEESLSLGTTQEIDEMFSHLTRLPSLDEIARRYINFVVKRSSGAKEVAARTLGIDRKTLYRKLKEAERQPEAPMMM